MKAKKADWEAIERDFRMGLGTVREIARRYEIPHTTISRRAASKGWTQDKSAEVRARARAKMLVVQNAPQTHQKEKTHQKENRGEPKDADLDAAADEQVSIHRAHRSMGAGFRSLATALLAEAQMATANIGDIQEAIDDETARDKTSVRRTMMMRAVSLPSRAAALNSLTSSGRNIQYIERLSHNLAPALPQDEGARDTGPYQVVQYDDIVEKPYKPKDAQK